MQSGSGGGRSAAQARPVVVAGRYELREVLGTGGASAVHAARDRVTGADVAVKLLDAGTANLATRVYREISALRLLRLPGVVALLDEGVHEGTRYLVMDLVRGRPFPGGPTPVEWTSLAPLALSLLEVLARVHAAGVVHRDLKPSNVLVDAAGRVTVLDFGISWGPALGESVTMVGSIVGTPEYLAPEQFVGASGDARTDLYALGVMLYESVAGRPPHSATDFAELVKLKRSKMPIPLRLVAPQVPRDVAVVIDQLLAMDPDDRPQSAGEAMQLLFGGAPLPSASRPIPRLGGTDALERVVAAAQAGRSIDVAGPGGSGRTRLLADAAERLAAAGRAVEWLVPASAPYASLAGAVGGLAELSDSGHDDAVAKIRSRLEARLAAGLVLVADDAERLDRWSAEVVAHCRAAGAILRATGSPATDCVRLAELTEEDLRPLFAGPDRIFHLREDGARELWRRTGGLPARIANEIAAWVRAGIAHWEADRVAMRRETLNRLRGGQPVGDELLLRPGGGSAGSSHLDELLAWIAFAWPHATLDLLVRVTGQAKWAIESALEALDQSGMVRRLADGAVQPLVVPQSLHSWPPERRRSAHKALSIALAPGTPMRLRHLAAAGEPDEVADEAMLLAPELTRQGRTGDALVVLEEGLSAARRAQDKARETQVLVEFAKTCLAEGTPRSFDRALYEIGRAADTSAPPLPQIVRLLHGARAAVTGDPEEALSLLADTAPFGDLDLELWRQGQRFRASRRLPLARESAVVAEVSEWAGMARHPRATASVTAWRALHLVRLGRPQEAADLHLDAARRTDRTPARMASQFNAGVAFAGCGRLDEARAAAEACRAIAAACRNQRYEGQAQFLLRAISYRSGTADRPDIEFVEAVESLGDPHLTASALLTEAAVAWRCGDLRAATLLAQRSSHDWEQLGEQGWLVVSRALGLLTCGNPGSSELGRLIEEAAALSSAPEAFQALGLLALADPGRATQVRSLALRRRSEVLAGQQEIVGQILTVDEVLEGLGTGRDPGEVS